MCSLQKSKRKALLIGISDDSSGQPLAGPKNDVIRMKKLLVEQYEYSRNDVVVLHDKQKLQHLVPTRENILREIDNLVRDARPGDRFVFHYSGHTGQQKNLDGTEEDGWDECIKTKTGPILDDELRRRLVDPLCPGSQLVAILDSCHSATLLDLPHVECHLPLPSIQPIPEKRKEPPSPKANIDPIAKEPEVKPKGKPRRLPSTRRTIKRPRLTLDVSPKASNTTFRSSGPHTSILPGTTPFVFSASAVVASPTSPIKTTSGNVNIPARRKTSEFYGEPCNNCPLVGRDKARKKDEELPMVLAISACKDSQLSYEDSRGNGMTKALYLLLSHFPNPTLHRLFNSISFGLFEPAYDRVHSEGWMEWSEMYKKQGLQVNAYQHPSLSSLQRLNPSHKLVL